MYPEKLLKIAGLNIGIAVVDTVLFSPGILGLHLGGTSAFETAFGATAIFMSVVVFAFGNYKLLTTSEKMIQAAEINTLDDCISALKQNHSKKTFEYTIDGILEQIKRYQNKKETIRDILLQKFDSSEMSYSKFEGTISDVEKVFYLNIKSIVNKLNAFDEDDYNRIRKGDLQKKLSKEVVQSKLSIYNEYISFVSDAVEDNEEILLKLDKLLLEISKLNSLAEGEIENMSAMKEIDALISQTKFYKE